MNLGLEEKVAIVTGGAGKIGRAISRALIEEGTKVAVFDVKDVDGSELDRLLGQDLIEEFHIRYQPNPGNFIYITDDEECRSFCDGREKYLMDEFGFPEAIAREAMHAIERNSEAPPNILQIVFLEFFNRRFGFDGFDYRQVGDYETLMERFCFRQDVARELFARLQELKTLKIGNRIKIYNVDVSNKQEVNKAVRQVESDVGRVHVMINGAGIAIDNYAIKLTDADYRRVMDINYHGARYCTMAVLPGMRERKGGNIVFISSGVAFKGARTQSAYAASKAAMTAYGQSLSTEVIDFGIKTTIIAPGFVYSEMTDKLRPDLREFYKKLIPVKRFGFPSEVARSVLGALDQSNLYDNGVVIRVNGAMDRV